MIAALPWEENLLIVEVTPHVNIFNILIFMIFLLLLLLYYCSHCNNLLFACSSMYMMLSECATYF